MGLNLLIVLHAPKGGNVMAIISSDGSFGINDDQIHKQYHKLIVFINNLNRVIDKKYGPFFN
jgi:hypothetical protein